MDQPVLVFHGELDSHTAQIYVEWAERSNGEWTLRGQVRGPFSAHARTLPATFALRDLGPGPSLLARATVADPCFWAPDQPFYYEVGAEVGRGTEVLARAEQIVGLRHLGLLRGQLYWERQVWTLIGCRDDADAVRPWSVWRDQHAVRVVVSPSEVVCRDASLEGVVLVAHLDAQSLVDTDIERETRRIGKWPAVAMLLITGDVAGDLPLRDAAPNCLLAAAWNPGQTEPLASWAQVAMVSIAEGSTSAAIAPPPIPWIAQCRQSAAGALEQRVALAREWVAQWSSCGSCVGCIV